MTRQTLAVATLLFLGTSWAPAQPMTLKQCLAFARTENSNVKIARIESAISGKKVTEQIGKGLPQVSATGQLENNLDLATSLMPGELFGAPGTYIPIKTGTKYDANATVSLSQKLLDASFWVGLKAAKLSDTQSNLSLRQADENTCYNVCVAYFRTLVLQRKRDNLQTMLNASRTTLASTLLKFKNGIGKAIDVDKIRVSSNTTQSQLQEIELNYTYTLNMLKYCMGMPMDSSIVLTDTLDSAEEFTPARDTTLNLSPILNARVEYQMEKLNLSIQEADRSNNIAAFFPTISLFANYSFKAMSPAFDVFKSGTDWYKSSAVGLTVSLPIFSGFQKISKVSQSDLGIREAEESIRLKERAIHLEVSNVEIQYTTAINNIRTERDNLALAERVYRNTQLEYQQGSGSSLELIQSESVLRETQNNYYTTLLALYTSRLDREKARGTLTEFINHIQ